MKGLKGALKALPASVLLLLAFAAPALAAPVWNVVSEAQPTAFQPSDGPGKDAYYVQLENIGNTTSSGATTLVDHLPAGITTSAAPQTAPEEELGGDPTHEWSCSGGAGQSVVECVITGPVPPLTSFYRVSPNGNQLTVAQLAIPVQVASGTAGTATNVVTVSAEWHDGNVYLISDGTDTQTNAGLIGMDASGANVFFVTADKLVGQDTDEDRDVYDARIDGGFPAAHASAELQRGSMPGPAERLACAAGGGQH